MAGRILARNATRDVVVAGSARVAKNAFTRLVGLLRDAQLAEGDGLWILPCNSIHSFGMRFVFDAVFLDREMRVVHLMGEMKPWRISKIVIGARSVLEVPAGTIFRTGTEVGDQFEMVEKN